MLTQEAFNALLKTLEEPPPSVVFILATTNPLKLPQTILSRCERFVFKRLSVREISSRLKTITDKENIAITDRALHYVAIRADGSVRDGESILEQLVSFVEGEITEEDVFKLIGFLGSDFYREIVQHVMKANHTEVLCTLNRGIEEGADPLEMYRGLVDYLREALLVRSQMPAELLDLSDEEIEKIKSMDLDKDDIMRLLDALLKSEDLIKRSLNPRIAFELVLCQLIRSTAVADSDEASPEYEDVKQKIMKALQAHSPKLAALVHKSEVKVEGNEVAITAENDFVQQQLQQGKDLLAAVLKKVLKQEPKLQVGIAEKARKENSLEDTIRALFDGEEVR